MPFLSGFQPFMTSLKHNKRERTTLFEKEPIENNGAYGKITDKKKLSTTEFKRFQATLKENKRRKELQLKLLFGAIMLLIIFTISYFLFVYKY